ncbi:MAG: 5'-3' exonuclease [Clostridia bacterium]|nr:5'-3' exonuclease [Clostridia bacterium]
MDKMLIVDGSALLFQSFFGMPNKIVNSKGQNIEAVICFVGILHKVLRSIQPQRLLVVFDGENELNRQHIDNEYKANRQSFCDMSQEDNPFEQLALIRLVLNSLHYYNLETVACEADDYIASVVNQYADSYEIVIMSSDKDFYQLVRPTVSVYTYRGKVSILWTQERIIQQYGFSPQYFTTLKSLVGDSSDNIKGVYGIGIKTATALIQAYGELSNIMTNINMLSPRIAKLLIDNYPRLLRNYSIIDLKNICLPVTIPDCLFTISPLKTSDILRNCQLI